MLRRSFCFLLAYCVCLAASGAVGKLAAEPPKLPRDPAQWVNSAPVTLEQLRGKAVFLWFFEETCPDCREMWPDLQAKARKLQDKPIVFVAVNSGNSPASVQEYARSVDCRWPILVDVDRSFEKACELDQINDENVCQICWISSNGELADGDWSEIDSTISDALVGAAWKIDPAGIPTELRETWRAIEFGNYKFAAPGLKKSLGSRKADIRDAARKLKDLVLTEANEQLAPAKQAQEAGQFWKAFEVCQLITDRFSGIELLAEVGELKKTLQKESQVKTGLSRQKVVAGAFKALSLGRPLSKKVRADLEVIVAEMPDTELARDAQKVLDRVK